MQSQLKVLAPVITRDVTLPNTSKKVPMVMVHVPESKTMMAIPLSTLSQMNSTTASTTTTTTSTISLSSSLMAAAAATAASSSSPLKDEQQAKDLLDWTDGIGTLDGCDLRFKINQLGCLELLDSDDEANLEHLANKHRSYPPPTPHQAHQQKQKHQQQPYHSTKQQQPHCQDHNAPSQVQDNHHNQQKVSSATSSNNTSSSSSSNNTTITNGTSGTPASKKASKTKQISPGSSLLRDGPDNRRSRASSSATTPTVTPATTPAPAPAPATSQSNVISSSNSSGSSRVNSSTSTAPLAKRSELNEQNFLLEKLIPKKRLEEIKAVVENWSIEDVRNFVDSIPGCSGIGQLFESQQICGKSLMYLDQKDLVEIIHIKLGPAIKIYNAISLIKL